MRIKRGLFLFLILCIIPLNNIYADDFSISMNCPESIVPNGNISCSVNIESNAVINNLTANYELNGVNGTFNYSDETGITSGPIGTINITAPSVSNLYTISLTSISANNGTLSSSNKSSAIRVKSTENRLSSLLLSSGSISFNSDVDQYDLTVDTDSIVITATSIDQNATVSGTGTILLRYGLNPIEVKVTPEVGTSKIYKLNITRKDNRNTNNYLSSLFITNTDIEFNKNILTYNLTTTSSQVTISATKEQTLATVSGDIGKKQLDYGLNKFNIVVTAENGSTRTYIVNITRTDDRSDNNYLKSLTLSQGTLKFNKNITVYDIDVNNDVEKIKITATLDNSKAKFVDNYGPREVNLNTGNNSIEIKVINEKGEQRTYTLNINRDDGRLSDSSLKSIELSDGKIDFEKSKLEYNINVEYEVKSIKVTAIANSDKAKVTIEGGNELQLGVNEIKIIVEAENGKITNYIIKVTRKEKGYELSSNNYITSLTIKGHGINFSSDVYNYLVKTKASKLDLSISLEDKKSVYEIIGNKNLKDGSKIIIKVTAENGSVRKYTINIKKSNNIIIISIMILITLIAVGLIAIVLLKRKKKKDTIINQLDSEENDIEVIDEDFSEF